MNHPCLRLPKGSESPCPICPSFKISLKYPKSIIQIISINKIFLKEIFYQQNLFSKGGCFLGRPPPRPNNFCHLDKEQYLFSLKFSVIYLQSKEIMTTTIIPGTAEPIKLWKRKKKFPPSCLCVIKVVKTQIFLLEFKF